PLNVISSWSELEGMAPTLYVTVPYDVGEVCNAKATSGLEKRLNRPSASMALAPETSSSAGCATNMSVPCHLPLRATSAWAEPIQLAMWMSWPQLCATNVSRPLESAFTLLA